MTENKREFLPFELQAIRDGHSVEVAIYDANGKVVLEDYMSASIKLGDKLIDKAAFIVRACNTHDELLAALEDLLKYKGVMSDESTERANAAIAKARGEE